MSYIELLKSPLWQRKRLEILQRDSFSCQLCTSESETLHVHHRLYTKGKKPWEYPDELLITLCEYCHSMQGYVDKNFEFEDCAELEKVIKHENNLGFLSIGFLSSYDEGSRINRFIIQDQQKNIIGLVPVEVFSELDNLYNPIYYGQD